MASPKQPPETRPSLILRLRNREDLIAWQEFIEIYQPLVIKLARKRGLQKADAEDVAQDVLASVAKHIEQWKTDTQRKQSFRAWLATITRNQTFLFFRKQSRKPTSGMDSQINRIPAELQQSEFDLEHDRQVFAWAARRVQPQFEPSTWQAFWLTAVEEKSIADASQQLGKSVGQIYVARSRVMSALRTLVQDSDFGSSTDWRVS